MRIQLNVTRQTTKIIFNAPQQSEVTGTWMDIYDEVCCPKRVVLDKPINIFSHIAVDKPWAWREMEGYLFYPVFLWWFDMV